MTELTDHLRALEESLLDPIVRHNRTLVSALLTEDFIEFGGSGRVFNKAAILQDLEDEPPRLASLLSEFNTRELTPGVVLATYKATRRNTAGEPVSQSWRSSIWAHVNGQWQLTFHQGTTIPTPQDHPKNKS